jgi:hypothetical protein
LEEKAMAKKIIPKEQTTELNRARLEILRRNPEKLQEIQKLIEKNEKGLDEYATRMATISGECNEESKRAWKTFASEAFFDKDCKAKVFETETFPAATAGSCRHGFFAYINAQIMLHGIENLPFMTKDESNGRSFMTKEAVNEKYLDYLCKDARQNFNELTYGQPVHYLLMGIDLRRSKEVILAEVAKLITQHQDMAGTEFEGIKEKRLKWLPIIDKLFTVWDMREEGKSFLEIKESHGITIDLAKKRFYRAFSLITDQAYNKKIWAKLLRAHLEKIATTTRPTDKEFWDQVAKIEEVKQPHLIPKNIKDDVGIERNPMEPVGQDGNYEREILVSDLRKICFSCPDSSCRTKTTQCLSEFEAGDMGAFTDHQPDCPKFYNYLKS